MNVPLRLLISALSAVALVLGGVALERMGPNPVSAGGREEPISGAWSCPHGGGEGWKVWVTVTNPGPEPVEARITTSAGGAATPPSSSVIPPSTLQYFEIAAPIAGSATVVEYLGGTVGVGSVVVPPEGGLAAEPCVSSPGSAWSLPEASTLRGETANLVVHNPFAAQAVVDVILTAGEQQIRPGNLQGIVLGPLDARAFELNRFALGQRALTGTVIAVQGRVAVATVVVSTGGIRSALGVPEPATRWLLPGVGEETDIVVRALPENDAPVSAEIHGQEGPIPALDLEAVAAGTAEAFGVLTAQGGLVVRSDGPRPMVAGRRMVLEPSMVPAPAKPEEPGNGNGNRAKGEGPKGKAGSDRKGGKKGGGSGGKEEEPPPAPEADIAATAGVTATADRWLVPPAAGPEGQPSILLLQNPGETEVTVSVTLLGTGGPLANTSQVTVPPRTTIRVPVEGGPATALVEGGGVVAAQATLAAGAFAVLLGVPI